MRGLKSLADSHEAYEEAGDYYTGEIDEYFSNPAIKAALKKAGLDGFRYNFAAVVVDKLADRWKPGALKGKNETIDAVLAQWWKENTLDEDLDTYLREAAKLGDYFVTVWPSEVIVDPATNAEVVTSVEVFGNSPLTTRLIYSRENSRRAVFGIRAWETTVVGADEKDEERVRVNLLYPDKIEQWISTTKASIEDFTNNAKTWELYDDPDSGEDDELGIVDNPWDEIPLFHLRVGSKPYGTPVHKNAYGPQDSINKIVMTHMSTIDQLGFPQRYGIEDPEGSELDNDLGEVFGDDAGPGENEQEYATGPKSKLKAGEFWYLKGIKEVGQFEAAGADPFLKPAEFALRAMAALTGSPLSDFGIADHAGAQSGEAKRRDAAAQIARAEKERVGLGRVIERMAEFALKILGYENEKVDLTWLPADISTDKEGIELVGLKISNGVPVRVALKEAGYPIDEVDEWWPEGTPAYPIAILDKLAAALQALGAAKTLGVVQDADIAAIIPGVFSAAKQEGDRPMKNQAMPEIDPAKLASQT